MQFCTTLWYFERSQREQTAGSRPNHSHRICLLPPPNAAISPGGNASFWQVSFNCSGAPSFTKRDHCLSFSGRGFESLYHVITSALACLRNTVRVPIVFLGLICSTTVHRRSMEYVCIYRTGRDAVVWFTSGLSLGCEYEYLPS